MFTSNKNDLDMVNQQHAQVMTESKVYAMINLASNGQNGVLGHLVQ